MAGLRREATHYDLACALQALRTIALVIARAAAGPWSGLNPEWLTPEWVLVLVLVVLVVVLVVLAVVS